MIEDNMLDAIIYNALGAWFLALGFQPNVWDPNDQSCVRNVGAHRIYYMDAAVPDHKLSSISTDSLYISLSEYLKTIRNINRDATFVIYSIEVYKCTCCDTSYVCISVYN